MIDPVIQIIMMAVVSAIFIVAVAHKLVSIQTFKDQLNDYKLISERWVPLFALLIPVFEAGSVFLYLYPETRSIGGVALVSLLLIYIGAIGINLLRGRSEIDCGCAGKKQQHLGSWLLLRNSIIIFFIILSLFEFDNRSLLFFEWLMVATSVFVFLILYWSLNNLLANRSLMKTL